MEVQVGSIEGQRHAAAVDAMLARAGLELDDAAKVEIYVQALGAVWNRAILPLGEVTLGAIVDRVVLLSGERHPAVKGIDITASGIDLARVLRSDPTALAAGLHYLLVELLVLLGSLTAEILSPALHDALARLGLNVAAGESAQS